MLIHWLKPLYEGDDPPAPQGGRAKPSELLTQYGGDAVRMAEKLAEFQNDNYKLRERNRDLTHERDQARANVPADGSLVLSADDARRWTAYQELGKPEELKTTIEAGKTGQERLATLERDATIRAAADAHGYKAAALAKLPSLAGKPILVEDAQEDGKTVKRAFVQFENAKVALPDYITQHDPEFAAALAAEPAPPGGTQLPPQGGAGGKPPSDLAAKFIEQQEARRTAQVNPLLPKQGA